MPILNSKNDACPFCGGRGRATNFFGYHNYVTLKFQLAQNVIVWMCLSEPVTQEAIDKLILLLEAQRDTFPMKSELRENKLNE